MSVAGSSSAGRADILFERPSYKADPIEVKEALTRALESCGSSLGQKLDLEEIEVGWEVSLSAVLCCVVLCCVVSLQVLFLRARDPRLTDVYTFVRREKPLKKKKL